MISNQLSVVLKAEGSFEEIHWIGSSAYSDGFVARGREGAPFTRVSANGIRAYLDFGAVRRGVWEITDIDISRLALVADVASSEGSKRAAAGSATASARTDEEGEGGA